MSAEKESALDGGGSGGGGGGMRVGGCMSSSAKLIWDSFIICNKPTM